jgi:hypothetical protein
MGGQQSVEYKPVEYSYDYHQEDEADKAVGAAAAANASLQATCGEKFDAAFGFDTVSTSSMVTSCFISTAALLTVRVFILAYAACILAWHWLQLSGPVVWLQSLTSWAHLLVVAYFLMAVYLTSKQLAGALDSSSGAAVTSSVSMRVTYVLYEFAFTWSVVTVALYWITEYPAMSTGASNAADASARTVALLEAVHLHGATLGFVLAELVLSRLKFQFTHYVFSAALALVYFAVNAIYFSTTRTIVHGFKWNSFFSVLVIFGVLFGILLSFVCGVLITTMRDVCYARNHTEPVVIPPEDSIHQKKRADGDPFGPSYSV